MAECGSTTVTTRLKSRPLVSAGFTGQREKSDLGIGRDLEDMVDHDLHRIAEFQQMADGCVQEDLGFPAVDAGQDDEARMYVLGCDESPEIAGICRHENEVFVQAASKDRMVGLAEAAEVARVLGKMKALPVDRTGDGRREALVQEEPHRVKS